MTGILRVPRSRGALSGLLLVLLGAWGALIPFIGPYFHYAFTPDRAWAYNSGRLWLDILPGAVTVLGGLIVLLAATRPTAVFGAWLAAMSGAWFVVGRPLSTLWTAGGIVAGGHPVGGTLTRAVEDIGFFSGLGAAVIFFAALALGRFTVIGVREATRAAAEEPAAAEAASTEPARTEGATAVPTHTEPASTVPASTGPASTVPASTGPASTVPASTVPARTEPAASEPAGPAAAEDAVTDRPVGRHSAQGSSPVP